MIGMCAYSYKFCLRDMGGGTGGRGGGTGPPQSFRRLTLCLWALHGKNRLQMVLVPAPDRALATRESEGRVSFPSTSVSLTPVTYHNQRPGSTRRLSNRNNFSSKCATYVVDITPKDRQIILNLLDQYLFHCVLKGIY